MMPHLLRLKRSGAEQAAPTGSSSAFGGAEPGSQIHGFKERLPILNS
jgi:hypothetical protein